MTTIRLPSSAALLIVGSSEANLAKVGGANDSVDLVGQFGTNTLHRANQLPLPLPSLIVRFLLFDLEVEQSVCVRVDAMKKDGNGFISKLGPDGKVVTMEWVKGLDSPTGLALANGKLYAADVDRIAEIDVAKGEIIQRYEAPGSKFLNDLTADKTGRVYASDMVTNSIWVLDGGKRSLLMQDDALENPNGLLAEDGRLVVASWGKMAPDFTTKVPGHMKVVDLATKKVSALGDSTPAGNFDGVVPDGKGHYLVTDWMSGGLFHVAKDGKPTRLLPLAKGSADLGVGPDNIIMIPMMMDGTVLAYKVDTQ